MAVSKEPKHICRYSKNNAVMPHNDTFTVNRRFKGPITHKTSSPDSSPAAKSIETHLERCTRLERENVEVKNKLKKMKNYCRECKTDLQRFVKRFNEFKNINKELDSKNKQLLIKNQQMRQRVTDVLMEKRPQFEDLEKVTGQEKTQLTGTIIQLQRKVKHLTEQVRETYKIQTETPQDSQSQEKKTQLQQENKTLRETLEHNRQVLKDAELRAERSRIEKDELEKCLLTVQTEKNLLRQEVTQLHKEYMSLTNRILLQLQENKKAKVKDVMKQQAFRDTSREACITNHHSKAIHSSALCRMKPMKMLYEDERDTKTWKPEGQ
nr:uncharacterized protein si:dkey-256e7.8 [Misgurnus anguillicaudatus]